jgi:TM2 domain-containing membrane protein YozV
MTQFNYMPQPPQESKRILAGILGILLGGLGIHKFVLGYTASGLIMLLASILTCGLAYPIMQIVGLIEGIVYLTKSDTDFINTYQAGQKEWF